MEGLANVRKSSSWRLTASVSSHLVTSCDLPYIWQPTGMSTRSSGAFHALSLATRASLITG